MKSAASAREAGRVVPTTTTVLGVLWCAATLGWFRSETLHPHGINVGSWIAMTVALVTGWAVITRRRWGRLAMIGQAVVAAADACWAGACILTAPWPERATVGGGWLSVLDAYGVGLAVGVAQGLLWLFAIAWLTRAAVRREFAARKRTATGGFQWAIAAVLLAVDTPGLWLSGATRHTSEVLNTHHVSSASLVHEP